jgi:hypothetical protein
MASDGCSAYDIVEIENDKSYKGCKRLERILVSLSHKVAAGTHSKLSSAYASPDMIQPALYVGDSSGNLHEFSTVGWATASENEPTFLKFHQQLKKVYHESMQILDSWGVCVTIVNGKLAHLALPLEKDSTMITVDDTTGALFFSVHELSSTLCCLVKQSSSLLVFDWAVSRKLLLRTTHNVIDKSNETLQSVVCLGSDIAALQYKRRTVFLHLNTGRVMELPDAHRREDIAFHLRLDGKFQDYLLVASKDEGVLVHWTRETGVVAHGRVEWSAPPIAAVAHDPFLLLAHDDYIDVLLSCTMQRIHQLPLKNILCMVPAISVMQSATAGYAPCVFVASSSAVPFQVHLVRMKPILNILEQCIRMARYVTT